MVHNCETNPNALQKESYSPSFVFIPSNPSYVSSRKVSINIFAWFYFPSTYIHNMNKPNIIKQITDHYLNTWRESGDFNWLYLGNIDGFGEPSFIPAIIELIQERKIDLVFWDRHPNPFIKALLEDKVEVQIMKLRDIDMSKIWEDSEEIPFQEWKLQIRIAPITLPCAYPSQQHLEEVVDKNEFNNRPYTLKLALGEPELDFNAFQMSVLEFYRNDPRYYFEHDDIKGNLHFNWDEKTVKKHNDIFLKEFWFAFDKTTMRRYVAVSNIDLSNLSPEHQNYWKMQEEYWTVFGSAKCFLHPVYADYVIWHFSDKVIAFDAILEELREINKMGQLINGNNIFHKDYLGDRPKEFGFILRPTSKEYYSFAHTLDKILSDNLNTVFFTSAGIKIKKEDWTSKWTITLLEEYMSKFKPADKKPMDDLFKKLRNIRNTRNATGHKIIDNEFNESFLEEQKTLLVDAYTIVRTLRLVLTNHPRVRGYRVPEHLYTGEDIIFY